MKTKARTDVYRPTHSLSSGQSLKEEALSRQHPLTLESKSPEPIQPSIRLPQQRKLLSGESYPPPQMSDEVPTRSQRFSGWLRLQLQELKQTTASVFTTSSSSAEPPTPLEAEQQPHQTHACLKAQDSKHESGLMQALEEDGSTLPPLLMPLRDGQKSP